MMTFFLVRKQVSEFLAFAKTPWFHLKMRESGPVRAAAQTKDCFETSLTFRCWQRKSKVKRIKTLANFSKPDFNWFSFTALRTLIISHNMTHKTCN